MVSAGYSCTMYVTLMFNLFVSFRYVMLSRGTGFKESVSIRGIDNIMNDRFSCYQCIYRITPDYL